MKIGQLPDHLKEHGLQVVKCWWEKTKDGVSEFVVGAEARSGRGNRKPWHTDEYVEYMASPAWKEKRETKLAFSPACEKKNRRCKGPLQVHHKSYDNLSNERLDELVTLCESHHRVEHVAISATKKKYNQHRKGFDTWMTKRHARDWEQWADSALVEDEQERFEEWLDEN